MSIKYKQLQGFKRNLWKADAKRADNIIKYCPKCKQCYEVYHSTVSDTKTYQYLPDFPSYKKEKKVCNKCNKKGVSDDNNS